MSGTTIQDAMDKQGLSRYRLSKISGIPWATRSDICTGKTALEKCSAGTILRLAKALNLTMEETLDLETGEITRAPVIPSDESYLELDLPEDLAEAIQNVKDGFENGDPNMDLLLDELYGSINANQWSQKITKGQADYLRSKYYYGDLDD